MVAYHSASGNPGKAAGVVLRNGAIAAGVVCGRCTSGLVAGGVLTGAETLAEGGSVEQAGIDAATAFIAGKMTGSGVPMLQRMGGSFCQEADWLCAEGLDRGCGDCRSSDPGDDLPRSNEGKPQARVCSPKRGGGLLPRFAIQSAALDGPSAATCAEAGGQLHRHGHIKAAGWIGDPGWSTVRSAASWPRLRHGINESDRRGHR